LIKTTVFARYASKYLHLSFESADGRSKYWIYLDGI